MFSTRRFLPVLATAIAALCAWFVATTAAQQPGAAPPSVLRPPVFAADEKWPTVPNNWVLGEVSSIAVDSHDHIWVLHRPASIPADKRAQAAPPVLEFDTSGKLLSSWGGPGAGFDWPEREHGIWVDSKDFVWISGNGGWPKPTAAGSGDDMILKFTNTGKLVLQIGKRGQSKGNTDTANVHQPADVFVDAVANELYVADGYGNQRVVVFDAESGKFKRMWGAFGNAPTPTMAPNPATPTVTQPSPEGPPQFGLVHAVKVSTDRIVYVADRTNNRVQLFTPEGKFLSQVRFPAEGGVTPVPAGFAFSPDAKQQYLYVVDSGPMKVQIYDRQSMTLIGSIGNRGPKPGQFDIIHHMATDSKGDIYGAEIVTNRRAQRFVLSAPK
jgi:DNA-binding beta-propeller fold protein YncE